MCAVQLVVETLSMNTGEWHKRAQVLGSGHPAHIPVSGVLRAQPKHFALVSGSSEQ